MASGGSNNDDPDQVVPEDSRADVRSIQSHYLRCPSASSRFSLTSETDTDSIFLEPIHLSSAVAAKKIISEELKPRAVKVKPIPESMLESARQLMVEDLYNRVKDMLDDTSSYNTPCVLDIQRAMVQDRLEAPFNPADEVWPSIFIAEKTVAVNKSRLKRMGITHILNAAHSTGVYTSKEFYKDLKIRYHGVEVDDFPYVDIFPHFRKAAEFMDEALLTHRGTVLVNSVMGISRSAVLVAAYLMIFHHMTIMEALLVLRKKRPICPNEGFLKQLRQLNEALLLEREGDEHSDSLSQGSAIEARTSWEEEQSILGAEVHSMSMVEEEDGKSQISSGTPITQRHSITEHSQQREDKAPTLLSEQEADDDNERMICEWQQRTERCQGEDWCQAQLMREDKESLLAANRHLPEVLESAHSLDILKEQVWARGMGCHPQADFISTVGSSYADMGKQWLRDTEMEATHQYRRTHQGEGNMTRAKSRQEDETNQLSESHPLYRSCMKNKDKLTPLEQWCVKRMQFSWTEKDTDTKRKAGINDKQKNNEEEEIKAPALEDVELSAYQTWKLKQQKTMGADNKDEIMELSRVEDTASAKRKQHREDVLEHSRQNLEESQSASGCETESCLSSGDGTLPTVWSNVSTRSASEDVTSLQSSHSSSSQIRSILGQPPAPPMILSHTAAQVPIESTGLLPNTQRPEVVNLASIQNLISNEVTETLFQKQDEGMTMEGNLPGNQVNSVLSLGMLSFGERTKDEGKTSIESEASYSRSISQSWPESVLSVDETPSCPGMGAYKGKFTDTNVSHSLFQNQVSRHKLDPEIRGKMFTYEMQKIATDNKRSTLFKKKKPKEENDEDDEDHGVGMLKTASKYNPTFVHERLDTRTGLTERPSDSVIERNHISNNNGWWSSDIKTPSTHPECLYAEGTKPRNSTYTSFEKPATESSFAREQEQHQRRSKFYPRIAKELSSFNQFQAVGTIAESHLDPCSERLHQSKLPSAEDFWRKSLTESHSYRVQKSYATDMEEQEEKDEFQDYTVKRKFRFRHYSRYEDNKTEVKRGGQVKKEKEEDGASSISQSRLRHTTKVDEDQL